MMTTPRQSQKRPLKPLTVRFIFGSLAICLVASLSFAGTEESETPAVSTEQIAAVEEALEAAGLDEVFSSKPAPTVIGADKTTLVDEALGSAGTRVLGDQLSRDLFGVTVGPFGMYLIRETIEFENGVSVRLLRQFGPWTGPTISNEESRKAGDDKVAAAVLEQLEERGASLVEEDSKGKMYAFEFENGFGQVLLFNPPSTRAVWVEVLKGHEVQLDDKISENMWFGIGKTSKNGQIKKNEETFTIPNRRGTDFAWEVRSLDKTPTEYWLSLRYPAAANPPEVADGAKLNRELNEVTMPFGTHAERVGFAITVTKGDPSGTYQLRLRDSTREVVAAVSYLLEDED